MDSIEICAGAGGQALGLELAGFEHRALVEIDADARKTLKSNRPHWNVLDDGDVHHFSGKPFAGIDLLAGGVPCPPFSKAGHQLGRNDERDLFPQAIRLVDEARPKALLLENVRGLLDPVFSDYRDEIKDKLKKLGYTAEWRLLNASEFGVPQLRPRAVLVGIRNELASTFTWPAALNLPPPTVGEALVDLMAERKWKLASDWKRKANAIAPTLVGGSKKHGGPDLGPTRARKAWLALGVEGRSLADQAPDPDFDGLPKLTVRMAARIQGFPDDWGFFGGKTTSYRQVGNAFPPPVAAAIGSQIRYCLERRARPLLKCA